jgi:phosphate transport system permease protein
VDRTRGGAAIGRLSDAVTPEGGVIDGDDDAALSALLHRTRQQQRRLLSLQRSLEQARRPLTRIEERLQRLRRRGLAEGGEGSRELAALEARHDELHAAMDADLARREAEIAAVRERLRQGSLRLEISGTVLSIPLDEVHALVWSNRLGPGGRLLAAARSVLEFLVSRPRQANTEGGIFPALFGTVLLVLLMTVAVMPLGVLAAVYLYEYATDGPLLRLADQAVNNLAGVPSIVFGMFGLAFFVYGLGGAVDRTLFTDDLPDPTFGTGGILWASLTLAVLTIPVVVVATREGLQAVPREWRDGARALGATRWQSLRSIILPAALPGILTGLILAVGRAAGEVAPLMLTGVVKLANGLPVDGSPPFLHLQRKFMHLSFHVYDVSMQSPNVEAAKPMAFASTLVLLVLVVIISLGAIMVRQRVRSAYGVIEE